MQINRHKILESKIQIPDVQKGFQKRNYLLDELAAAEEKLMIMHATIGYGKTVLMSQYVRTSGQPCAWYHLDSLDNEVSTFVQYLILAFQRALGDFVFEAEQYMGVEGDQVSRLSRELVMELMEYLEDIPDKKLILVLDDFQVLDNQEIFGLLEELLNHTGGQFRLFIATKSTIPDLFTKYVMNGRGRIIDYHKLSFNKEEVYGVLERLLTKEEADKYTDMISDNMEGWPAGVMFAALYLRQMGNMGQQVEWENISQESLVHNYITYELFKSLPFDLQNFLLRTSFADQLQPELCNYICGITNASAMLKYLLQENMFITHVGEKSGNYRYHSIFRSFLKEQAGDELRKDVCGKLAEYYMRHNKLAVAAQYAMEAGAADLLLIVVEKEGISMLREGKRKLVEEYLQKLMDSGLELTPAVWYVMSSCLLWNGETEKGLKALDTACQGEKDYLIYRRFYRGLELNHEGKKEEGTDLIRECCRQLIQKKWVLPVLNDEEKELSECIWNEEAGGTVRAEHKLISVSCFGRFEVKILPEGKEISWRTRKAMELFAYLVDLGGKPVERRVLLEQLWPEEQPNNAVAMLHNMIYSIRKELSVRPGLEELIQYRNRQYYLDMTLVKTDLDSVSALCSLAEQGNVEELMHHREQFTGFWGVYLEEVDGAWCTAQRAYFERAYGKGCRLLANDCEKSGDFETAASIWRAYMDADRYSEEAVAGLLRSYGKLGERTQMKKVFDSARKVFKDELGLELGKETVRIYEEGLRKG